MRLNLMPLRTGGNAMSEGRILVIEDSEDSRYLLQKMLMEADYEVIFARDGEEGLAALRRESPDLVLLDWVLPGLSGEEVCRRARAITNVPIIVLTARSAEADRISGLSIGADDYVVKPFLPGELVARIRAHLRRVRLWSNNDEELQKIVLDDLEIDPSTHLVLLKGKEVPLTLIEFQLLYCLGTHVGKVLTRERLMDLVWGDRFLDPPGVNVRIFHLRQKIEEDPTHPQRLLTVRGVGYKLV